MRHNKIVEVSLLSKAELAEVAIVVIKSTYTGRIDLTEYAIFPKDTIFICLKPEDKIEFLNEKDMLQYGWVRQVEAKT